jgi:hypothetical protein
MNSIDYFIDLDHIIDYAVMEHNVEYADPIDDSKADNDGGNELLAYMAGQKSS